MMTEQAAVCLPQVTRMFGHETKRYLAPKLTIGKTRISQSEDKFELVYYLERKMTREKKSLKSRVFLTMIFFDSEKRASFIIFPFSFLHLRLQRERKDLLTDFPKPTELSKPPTREFRDSKSCQIFQFSEFETERHFDTVQILGGGRTVETATNIATLSGSDPEFTSKTFVSASNFMIIKFRSDGSVEKSGFRASWRTEAQTCGGSLVATEYGQTLTSQNYPRSYPGGLECLHTITAAGGQGSVITLEIEDLDMEPVNDFVLIRDGPGPEDTILAILSGKQEDNPRFVVSTGKDLYIYTQTDQADSRRGYRIKYYEGESLKSFKKAYFSFIHETFRLRRDPQLDERHSDFAGVRNGRLSSQPGVCLPH